jgi:site-specific recombinase XerD
MADDDPRSQLNLFPRPGAPGEYGPPVTNAGPISASSSLASASGAFYEHMLRQGFAENTVKAFVGDLRIFAKFFAGNKTIGEIATKDLNDFLTWLRSGRGKPCSSKSYARRVTTLKVFFGWLHESGVLPDDPAANVVHYHAVSPLPDILYDDEVERLLRVTRDMLWASKPDARPFVLVSLLLQTGIKKAECMAIRLTHLDRSNPQAPVIHVRHPNPRMAHKERRLAISQQLGIALQQYLNEYKPQTNLFECTARNLEYVLADAGSLAEIKKPVSFEALRWTAAVQDFRAGMPLERLRLKLGLSKITWQETAEKIRRLGSPAF